MAIQTSSISQIISNINTENLIETKKINPHVEFSLVEKIALLTGCIDLGEENAKQLGSLADQSTIVFLGNTGSGKSTLINYLAGCHLKYQSPRDPGVSAISNIVVVEPNTTPEEVMKIGHQKVSQTFMPTIASIDGRTYCDCPGFMDNHGPEIRIANIVNIRRIISASKDVRIVILVNWHSLLADKANGLRQTIEITQKFFGNVEFFRKHKDSISFGITKMEMLDKNSQQLKLEILRRWITNPNGVIYKSFENEVISVFSEKLFIYHPLDNVEELKYSGGLKRAQLLQKIDQGMSKITQTKIFKISLTDEDLNYLRAICESMAREIKMTLNNRDLNLKNYDNTKSLLDYVYKIKVVDHREIYSLVEKCREPVITHFEDLVRELYAHLSDNPNCVPNSAEVLFETISSGINKFNSQDLTHIKTKIKFDEVKIRYETHCARVSLLEETNLIFEKIADCRSKCISRDIKNAQKLFGEVRSRVDKLPQKFSKFNKLQEECKGFQNTANNELSALNTELDKIIRANQKKLFWMTTGAAGVGLTGYTIGTQKDNIRLVVKDKIIPFLQNNAVPFLQRMLEQALLPRSGPRPRL